jgi:hypothetical protein
LSIARPWQKRPSPATNFRALTLSIGRFGKGSGRKPAGTDKRDESLHHDIPFAGREALADASELIAAFGEHAPSEAALRARRSRDLGNVLHFCRWREAARMIALLEDREVRGAVH